MSDWTCSSNDALVLSLVRAKEDKDSLDSTESPLCGDFHGTFTYPIFGDDEKIYGYENLRIDLRFASGSLAQYLSVSYSEKLGSSSTVDDVEGILSKFLPSDYYKDEETFQKCVEEDAVKFRPAGQLIYSYARGPSTAKGKAVASGSTVDAESNDAIVYEVYHCTWNTPGFREYHRRMQIYVLLEIEAGSYISEDENTWEFVVMYERRKRKESPFLPTYHLVGYSSLYPFYCFPERVRMRLSQFIILKPYRRAGHGSELYKTIYQYVVQQPLIAELTVEDPAEAFEDLRDKNDLEMLLGHEKFMEEGFGCIFASHDGGRARSRRKAAAQSGKMGPPVNKVWAEKWRSEMKIAARQFQRLVEMLILKHLVPSDKRTMRAYRLQVKERLYRFNFETLCQLDREEKYAKLEETFDNVVADYRRILAMVL